MSNEKKTINRKILIVVENTKRIFASIYNKLKLPWEEQREIRKWCKK